MTTSLPLHEYKLIEYALRDYGRELSKDSGRFLDDRGRLNYDLLYRILKNFLLHEFHTENETLREWLRTVDSKEFAYVFDPLVDIVERNYVASAT